MSTATIPRKSPVTSAAPARATTAKASMGTRTFNAIALVVLIVFAVIWLIPSLFALKDRKSVV